MNMDSPRDRLLKARSALLFGQPFFGTLALHLEPVETDRFPTMATDGKRLAYNPAFVAELSDRELEGVLAHEIMHCAWLHHSRRGARDRELWNKAGDYCINRDLIAAGFSLPKGALIDSRFDGLATEEVFRILESDKRKEGGGGKPKGKPGDTGQQGGGKPGAQGQPQAGQGQPGGKKGQGQPQPGNGGNGPPDPGNGANGAPGQPGGQSCGDPGQCGEVLDAAPEYDAAGNAATESQWQARVRQAVAIAKAAGAGKLPGELARMVENLNNPRVDWRAILRRFIDDSASRDYSWQRPNRRFLSSGLVLPGYVPDRPSHIVAVMDTSGSIQDSDVAAFVSELQAMLDEGAADRVTIAYADTRIHRADEFAAGDIIEAKPEGGGGTSFRQPLDWIGENVRDASAIVYMTDCRVSDWGEAPAAPILWLASGDPREARELASRAPFGESIVLAD